MRRRGAVSARLVTGLVVTGIILGAALLSLVWTPFPVEGVKIMARLKPPGWPHLLGTDQFGRDLLSMMMVGARNSLLIALGAVALGIGVGVPLGLLAAQRGGLADELVARGSDLVFAFPALVTAAMLAALAGPGMENAILAIGIFNVPVFARIARGQALALWRRDFVLAARALGKSDIRITRDHVLPNLAHVLIAQASIQAAMAILVESGLAYVGLGPQPPAPSLGRMLAEAQTYVAMAPRLALAPGLLIVATVIGLDLLGEGLSERHDRRSS
ncbi:ABC transporter permease [Segnochrobactraceae bacterium EtOH-i3]